MTKTKLRIFSYQPNPRIFKSTITARICNIPIEVRGAKPKELKNWLWDFDAHPMSKDDLKDQKEYIQKAKAGYQGELYKTEAFLSAHPYGTVPAAFSPDGEIGVFESNSIMRAVARLDKSNSGLYGHDPYSASRIDGFLDTTLLFARESQIYLLALMADKLNEKVYYDTERALTNWLSGIESALTNNDFICSDALTLADICFCCELLLLQSEQQWIESIFEIGEKLLSSREIGDRFPRSLNHYEKLSERTDFSPDIKDHRAKIKSGQKIYD